ncbi:MAG: glycoside hydrolase family 88 protein [Oribacterium sp.]|nr:glycoside hydrolase family 88 protein [Oribacterium sp.]
MNIDRTELTEKLASVTNRLIHLDDPKNKEELEKSGEAIGYFSRDFGMKEWDWPQGVGLYGLWKIMEAEKSDQYMDYLENWYKERLDEGLPSRNINTTTPLLTLSMLNEKLHDKKYEKLLLDWADWLMTCLPRTNEGGFQHVTSANGDLLAVRLNENEMWIDTIFMTVLFLNRMGQLYHREDWIDEGIHQMLMHIKYLYDKKSGLFYHGWDFRKRNNFGGVFWLRGNSWFTVGILDYLEAFDGTLNAGVKKILVDTFRMQAMALRDYQAVSGLWHTVIDDSSSYEEASGSAAVAAGILKGIRMGILDDSFVITGEKAVKGILECIDQDGTVLKVSGGTGIGMTKEHYKNILIAPMAYGQSLTMLALAEALRHC